MPRITISIPASLKQRLEDPRVRKTINISRVCQEALSRTVQRVLDLPLELKRFERVLTRLKEERESAGDRWFQEGSAAAREWVEHEAPYALLRQLGESSFGECLRILKHAPPPALKKSKKQLEKEKDFSPGSYLEGFARTVLLLWEVIDRNL